MSESHADRIETLRQDALQRVRQAEFEEAIALYDRALTLCSDASIDSDETRELITINKADALIALERTGPEVNELPRVIMRRRSLRHVYLAAYALQYKHRLDGDLKRALFYGQLALRTAEEANEKSWRRIVLGELGNIYELDSQIPTAIECFQQVLLMADESAENRDRDLSHAYALENLGYCLLLQGNIEEGLLHVHEALEILKDPIGRAEAYVDLCFGYLEQSDYAHARYYGEAALEIAREPRQIRNAHYLTGEACYKAGDTEGATAHFDALAKFYPQFRNLKSLLFAIDLRAMVNLKL